MKQDIEEVIDDFVYDSVEGPVRDSTSSVIWDSICNSVGSFVVIYIEDYIGSSIDNISDHIIIQEYKFK